jgi:hypothetical protein
VAVQFNISKNNNLINVSEINAPAEITQFTPNLRFNHNNISYYYSSDCNEERRLRMNEAFDILQNDTEIISFYSIDNPNSADIKIGCSEAEMLQEKNLFIAGEGGPKEYVNTTIYPVILKGDIFLYKQSSCEEPIVELHELLHVFGFDHISNSKYIMYPIVNCDQKLSQGHIQYLVSLYSIEPLPDSYFDYANVTKSGRYLDFNLIVNNRGMIHDENVSIDLYSGNDKIGNFSLGEVNFGAGKNFYVQNFKLPSRNVNNIEFRIVSPLRQMNIKDKTLDASLS